MKCDINFSVYLFVCLSVRPSIYLSVYLFISVCLSNDYLFIEFQNPTIAKEEAETNPDNTPLVNTATTVQSPPPPSEYMALVPSTRNWELKRTDINVIKIIGKGAFSRVAKATATGVRGLTGQITVAVKMLKGTKIR